MESESIVVFLVGSASVPTSWFLLSANFDNKKRKVNTLKCATSQHLDPSIYVSIGILFY